MKNDRNNGIEDILASLDNNPKAAAPDFLYTRLKARMDRLSEKSNRQSWAFRPVYALAGLLVILVINAAVIWKGTDATPETNTGDQETAQTIASEYRLTVASSAYYSNQDNK